MDGEETGSRPRFQDAVFHLDQLPHLFCLRWKNVFIEERKLVSTDVKLNMSEISLRSPKRHFSVQHIKNRTSPVGYLFSPVSSLSDLKLFRRLFQTSDDR